jgi:uncharacterized membrane protein YeaQ/YmgE (transglycosylase-associated protein family)
MTKGSFYRANSLSDGVAAVENQAFMENLQQITHLVLVWVGFGTLVGLLAKAIMPGKDPGGAVATMAMGIAGTVIGCGVVSFIWKGHIVSPISPLGFCVATAGAFVLLFFYKLLGGYYFEEGNGPLVRRRRLMNFGRYGRRNRQATNVVYGDEQ